MFLIYERVWIQNIRNNMYTGLFLYRMILKYKNRCTVTMYNIKSSFSAYADLGNGVREFYAS